MRKDRIFEEKGPSKEFTQTLEEILQSGAQRLIQMAVEQEIEEFLESFAASKVSNGNQRLIRNGYLPKRFIQTGVGPISIQQPRVRDKESKVRFASNILPPYARRTPSIEAVVSTLYLRGISTNSFPEALEALLGENAKGLSPTNIVRLKSHWEAEYNVWKTRDLSKKRYIYFWADGIYFNVRLSNDRPCLLVIIGVLEDGTKEIVSIYDGHRESKLSWIETLGSLRKQGLTTPPLLAIGDGALGFWAALEEVFPGTKHQRCWVHKSANVLDKLPKSVQKNAKAMIYDIYMAPTKKSALEAFRTFLQTYKAKYPKACACLSKDKESLFTFYDFPAVHWQHIRTTNPIESTFATVRHRTRQTKGCGSRTATLMMVFKLGMCAEKTWQRLRGYQLIEKIIKGTKFRDGEEVKSQQAVA